MAFVSARCPNCGSGIQLDDGRDKGFCLYCGSALQVEEAVALLKIEHAGTVRISGVASDDSLTKRGFLELENKDYRAAVKAFDEALNINPENYLAWKGKFETAKLWARDYISIYGNRFVGVYWDGMTGPKFEGPTKDMLHSLRMAARFAPADERRELAELIESIVTKPIDELKQIEQWRETGKCVYCGGQLSAFGKCKECKLSFSGYGVNKDPYEKLKKKYPLFPGEDFK